MIRVGRTAPLTLRPFLSNIVFKLGIIFRSTFVSVQLCHISNKLRYLLKTIRNIFIPSSIYSYSIGHILERKFFCLGSQGSKVKKVNLRNSEQLLRVVFLTFGGQNKPFKIFQSCMK